MLIINLSERRLWKVAKPHVPNGAKLNKLGTRFALQYALDLTVHRGGFTNVYIDFPHQYPDHEVYDEETAWQAQRNVLNDARRTEIQTLCDTLRSVVDDLLARPELWVAYCFPDCQTNSHLIHLRLSAFVQSWDISQ